MVPDTRPGSPVAAIASKYRKIKQPLKCTQELFLSKAVHDNNETKIKRMQRSLDDQFLQLEKQSLAEYVILETMEELNEVTVDLLQVTLEVNGLRFETLKMRSKLIKLDKVNLIPSKAS